MKPIDLDELERLHAAATPGPWQRCGKARNPEIGCSCGMLWSVPEDVPVVCAESYRNSPPEEKHGVSDEKQAANAALVEALRNAFPALLRELRARRRQVERARETLGKLSKGNRSTSTLLMARMCRADLAALDHIGEPTEMTAAPAKGWEGET